MREAQFLAPVYDNDGSQTLLAQWEAERRLSKVFGAFSIEKNVFGVWQNEAGRTFADKSNRYIVAADWDDAKRAQFLDIAREFGRLAGQEAMYVKDDTGEVHIVQPETPVAVSGVDNRLQTVV